MLLDGQDLTAYTPNARARKLALMLPHTARTELTSCFEVAAAGRYPYTGRLGILSDADRQQVHNALSGRRSWRTAILPGSATASASACCWPARSASSRRFCFWTSQRHFWM